MNRFYIRWKNRNYDLHTIVQSPKAIKNLEEVNKLPNYHDLKELVNTYEWFSIKIPKNCKMTDSDILGKFTFCQDKTSCMELGELLFQNSYEKVKEWLNA